MTSRTARIAYAGSTFDAVVEDSDGTRLSLSDGRDVASADVVWLPPCKPRTILALGLNYKDHARELSMAAPKQPLVFIKGPNSLVGHGGTTPMPANVEQMHYECELAVVIGRMTRRVSRADAYAHVQGYTIANDYVIREYIENYYRPNLRAKSRDRSTVVGPWIVAADAVPDPMQLTLRTFVNDRLTQEGNTRDMIFDIPHLIEYLSSFMTLAPGDLILTGTPPGVRHLKPGDVVVTEIEGIGRLKNTLTGEASSDRGQGETA